VVARVRLMYICIYIDTKIFVSTVCVARAPGQMWYSSGTTFLLVVFGSLSCGEAHSLDTSVEICLNL